MISQLSKMRVKAQVRKRRHTSPSGMENIEDVEKINGHYMTRSKLESSMPILDQYLDDPTKAKRACRMTNGRAELGKRKKRLAQLAKLISNDENLIPKLRHVKPTENAAKIAECPLCKETFTDRSKFTLHLKKHHPVGETKCLICHQVLSSPSSLDRHILTHSKERPYNCQYCDQSFTTNGNMNRHMHKHESASNSPSAKSDRNSNSPAHTGEVAQMNENETTAVDEPVLHVAALDEACASSDNNDGTEVEMSDSTSSTEASTKDTTEKQLKASNPEEKRFPNFTFIPFSSQKYPLVAQKKYENPTKLPIDVFRGRCGYCDEVYSEDLSHSNTYSFHQCSCSITFKTQLEHDHHMAKEHLISNHEKKCKQGNFFISVGLCRRRHTNKEEQSTESQVMPNNSNREMSGMQKNESEKKNTDLEPTESVNRSHQVEITGSHLNKDICASELPALTTMEVNRCTENSNDFADIKSILSNVSVSPVSSEQSDGDSSPKNADSKNGEVSSGDGNASTDPSKGTDAANKKNQVKNKPEYFCQECDYKSGDKSSINRHMRKHTKEHPFVCIACGQKFTTKANGERHAKKKHDIGPSELKGAITYTAEPNENPHEPRICKYCNNDFYNNKILQYHYRSTKNSCSKKPFQCAVCSQSFSNKHNYKRHYRKKHDNDLSEAEKLERMRANCISSSNKTPIRKKHPAGGTVEINENTTAEDQDIDTNSSEASTSALPEVMPSFSDDDRVDAAQSLVSLSQSGELEPIPLDLSLHALDLSPNKPGRSEGLNERSALIQGSNSQDSVNSTLETSPGLGRIPTNAPSDEFSTIPLDLTRHQLTTGSSISTGPVADLMVPQGPSPPALKGACKVKDTKDRVKCEYCESVFTLKTNKERHVKNLHPDCWKSRGRRISSGSAQRSITHKGGIRIPHATKEALKRVLQNADNKQQLDMDSSSNRELHNKQAVKNEAAGNLHEMEVNSDLENVDLASVSSVIHTANSPHFNQYLTEDMSCNVLDKNASNNESFNPNNRGKSKENKYVCNECERTFQWTSSLQRHTVIHTGIKKFVCEECNQRCTTKSNLVRHYKNIHGEAAPSVQKNAFQVHNGHNNGEFSFSPIKTELSDTNETPLHKTGRHLDSRDVRSGTMSHSEVPDFECRYCKTSYKCERDLTNHTKELHPLEYANLQGKDID